ncbi:plasmid maintenance system antidote protein [Bifidobacterium sp. DSM 109960]|uniref:Plasmid maintenance system antidote protein n=1 Tax=Bifidobacterium erythrocebi TaxID=2675325 RepID=A0A7Y0ET85_9BIFI|nr:HigA family addiction module antitoxin [Bifidobacterium sp. DSM 109960]NMM95578.1 plasmid maintenance system antidote protein [Bifidobacterium sp. DSM 109960]
MSTSTTTTDEFLSTPGEILSEEFMQPLGITGYRLAKAINVSQTAISEIINGKRAITIPMAYRLAKAFGTTPEFWVNLQRDYDLLSFDSSQLGDIQPLVSA